MSDVGEALLLRPGLTEDADAIAPLAIAAGGGVYAFLLEGGAYEGDEERFVADAYRREQGGYSHTNTVVALLGGRIAGCANAFVPARTPMAPEMQAVHAALDPERVAVLSAMNDAVAPDDLFLNLLATAPWARRRGVATALLAQVAAMGRTSGAEGVTLQHWADNAPAAALYAAYGYREIARLDARAPGLRDGAAICVIRRLAL